MNSTDPGDPVERILVAFLESTPEADWAAGIEALCDRHPEHAPTLRRRFWSIPRAGSATPPERIGGYRILSALGEGGMGRVYLAVQDSTGREVVVKMLRPELLGARAAHERFQREVATAAKLDHPGICTVYEAGEADGVPYLVMRRVPGETLAAIIARQRSQPRGSGSSSDARSLVGECVAIAESLARALHVAHEAGLVHRDVKPANVIVQPDGQPVLLDFGLVRSAESESQVTLTGELVGTPAYMSPEQIAGGAAVDRRSDVYSLGATLYEMLTGRLPFAAPTRDELYRRILAGHAPRPSRVNGAVSGDLDTVIATAMEQDRGRRYGNAWELAEDLRRVRLREPIAAKPAGLVLRLTRWSQRNPAAATLTSSLTVALVVAVGLLVWGNLALAESRIARLVLESARTTEIDAKLALYLAFAAHVASGGANERALSRLADAACADSERARVEMAGDGWRFGEVWRAGFGPDGETVWLAGLDTDGNQSPLLARWREGDEVAVVSLGGKVTDFDVGPGDGTVAVACDGVGLCIVAADGSRVRATGIPAARVRFLDARRIALGDGDGNIRVLAIDGDGEKGEVLHRLEAPVTCIGVSPGRRILAVGSRRGELRTFDTVGLEARVLPTVERWIDRLWPMDDGVVAVRSRNRQVRVFDTGGRPVPLAQRDGTESEVLGSPRDQVNMGVLTSPSLLITGHVDQLVRIQDLVGRRVGTLSGHTGWVFQLAVSPDGRRLASGAGDGGVAVWDLPGRRRQSGFRHFGQPALLRFFPDGDRLLVASRRGTIWIHQCDDPETPVRFEHRAAVRFCRPWPAAAGGGFVTADATGSTLGWSDTAVRRARNDDGLGLVVACAVAGDGERCAVFSGGDRTLRILDRELETVAVEPWPDHYDRNLILGFGGPDHRSILAVSRFGKQPDWRLRRLNGDGTLDALPTPEGLPPARTSWALAFSPSGEEVLIGGEGDARLLRWSAGSLTELAHVTHSGGYVEALAFDEDGGRFLTGATDGSIRMWRRDGTALPVVMVGHKHPVLRIAFARDGDGVVSLADDELRVWNRDGSCRLVVTPSSGGFTDFALLADGRRVAIGSTASTVLVRRLRAEDIEARARQQLAGYEFDERDLAPFAELLGR